MSAGKAEWTPLEKPWLVYEKERPCPHMEGARVPCPRLHPPIPPPLDPPMWDGS